MTVKRYSFLNNVNAVSDFPNLLTSKKTSFYYPGCSSECTKNLFKTIKKAIDETVLIGKK